MNTGNAGKGRRPGSKNKFTSAIREAFAAAFDNLGGVDALVEWGRSNQTDFYKLVSKLIPTEIVGAGGEPIEAVIRVYMPANERDPDPAAEGPAGEIPSDTG